MKDSAEIFQHRIATALHGVDGVKNISDEIKIFASNKKEHDEIIHKVLQHLVGKNLTFNGDKCVFAKPEMSFFGVTFRKTGMKPDMSKVNVLKEMPPSENASAVKSI